MAYCMEYSVLYVHNVYADKMVPGERDRSMIRRYLLYAVLRYRYSTGARGRTGLCISSAGRRTT